MNIQSLAALKFAAVLLVAATSLLAQTSAPPAAARALGRVSVRNDSALARRAEVVTVSLASLGGDLKPADAARVWVKDGGGRDLVVQPIDLNGDYDDDTLAFPVDIAASASADFTVTLGERRRYKKEDFQVYGRFNRERFDDFAWENDKVAFRMYGQALETWVREPLTSSAVDAWVKKTSRLVVNDWYHVDDYHKDHGEGGDFYSAGRTRGCGGNGLMSEGKLFVSKNFRGSRVLSRGPIRLVFELTYEPWEVGSIMVRETKRVTLDAGSHFNRFESFYQTESGAPLPETVLYAMGIRKEKGADVRVDPKSGLIRQWQALASFGDDGSLGCAAMVDPARLAETPEIDGNLLIGYRGPAPYYAGTGWDRGGDFKTMADFDAHVDGVAKRLAVPLKVEFVR